MVEEQELRRSLRPEQAQRWSLGGRDREIRRFQKKIHRLLITAPLGFAQTEAGARLMEALQAAEDSLTDSRRSIRGEVSPLSKEQIV